MLRWLWRLQSDRGGQHAEAGVLMATLIVLAVAVTVGSIPRLSTAVANQWVCQISDRGSERCGGAATTGEVKSDQGFTAKTFDSRTDTAATTAGYTDPADSHFPPVQTDQPPRYTATLGGFGGEVDMKNCSVGTEACVGQDGTYYQCKTQGHVDPKGPRIFTTWEGCTVSLPSTKGFTCTDEGLSPTTDTCYNRDGIFHCYQVNGPEDTRCNDANNDADASIPDGQPVSCGKLTGDSATCMGSNGTLYQCLDINKLDNCRAGGRNISPSDPALTDCVPIVSHGDTTGQVVRCTYTPVTCNPEPANGSCADQAVSVRCLKDPPSDPNIEYEHCQSLGQIVPAGASLSTKCLTKKAGGCDLAASVPVTREAPDSEVGSTAQVGNLQVDVTQGFDQELSIPTGEIGPDGKEIRRNMSHDELATFCTSHASKCDSIVGATANQAKDAFLEDLAQLGVCTGRAECAAKYDAIMKAGVGPKRDLKGAFGLSKVQLGAYGLFAATGVSGFGALFLPEEVNEDGTPKTGYTNRRQLGTAALVLGLSATLLFAVDGRRGNAANAAQRGVNQAAAIELARQGTIAARAFLAAQNTQEQLAQVRDLVEEGRLQEVVPLFADIV